jgi:hypothetical protein
MAEENKDTRTGIIYCKYSTPWKNGEGESHYLVIEHSEMGTKKFKDKKTGEWKESYGSEINYIAFRLGRGMNIDDYSVNDHVTVKYKIRGIKYQKKDGTGEGFFNELEAYFVRFADLDAGYSNHKGVIKADDPVKKEFFVAPPPDDEEGLADLPF